MTTAPRRSGKSPKPRKPRKKSPKYRPSYTCNRCLNPIMPGQEFDQIGGLDGRGHFSIYERVHVKCPTTK